ncbi:MAG: TIGR02449 family protein [Rhodanobacteraceae bacterium]
MDTGTPNFEEELTALTRTLDAVLERMRKLAEENVSLRRGRDQMAGERAALLARNEQARSRVEAMIERLKSLEAAG